MKAVVIHDYGEIPVLSLDEVDRPRAQSGEVLVRLDCAGVNFIDIYMRRGVYRTSRAYGAPLPMTLGMEGAGIIEEIGPEVTDFRPGERVAYCLSRGSYAEYAVVPADKLVRVPDEISLETAAALMLQGSTAHYLSHSVFALQAGHSCLVHAGAGGVGQILVQLACLRGARVFATVGSPAKSKLVTGLGAERAILYKHEDFREVVRKLTDGQGVDVVYDSVGAQTIARSLASVRRRGMCVLFGASSGPVPEVEPMRLAEAGSIFFTRPHLADYMQTSEERRARARSLFEAVRRGQLAIGIDRRFQLSEVAEAHHYLETGQTKGKLVLSIGASDRVGLAE